MVEDDGELDAERDGGMKVRGRALLFVIALPVVTGLALVSCGDSGKSAGKPATKPAAAAAVAKPPAVAVALGTPLAQAHPTTIGPIDFIAANCAKCHGPEASLHKPEQIAKYRDDEKLRTIIRTMLTAQAPQQPREGDDFETIVSYHRSVIAHQPFIAVTDAKLPEGKGDGTITLEGEVSSKSELSYAVKGETYKVAVEGPYWTAIVPLDATEVIFTAVKDGATTVLDYPQHVHSHDVPLSP